MATQELLLNVFFYIFAFVALGGAAAVALSRNIVRSAFALLAVLFAAAAMYAFMRADFLVVAQIIIYVGGILVLIIFAVMLTHKITDVKLSNESAPGPAAIFGCVCVFFSLLVIILTYKWDRTLPPRPAAVPPIEGRAAIPLELWMTQGDGRTHVAPGNMVLDGYVNLNLLVNGRALPERTKVRIKVDKKEDKKEGAGWKEHKVQDLQLAADRSAVASFERLPTGSYRWAVQVDLEKGVSPWIPYATTLADGAADFTSEAGLTKPLGRALAGPYLLPFEAISVLLLAALVGAAFLARKEVKE